MKKTPPILYIDIETAPALIAAFPPLHETNAVWIERGTYIMGFAAMWEGETRPKAYFLPDYPLFKRDIHSDKALCADLHAYLDAASVICAHNGDRFDLKTIRSRLLINNYPPPSPIKSIDTLKATRSIFNMDSNRLDSVSRATGIGQKMATTGKDLWRRCYHGDRDAFKTMAKYCQQDTLLLAKYYRRIRNWMPNHIDLRSYSGAQGCCPVCLSDNINRRGTYVLGTRLYQQYQCQDCSKWFSGKMEKHHAQTKIVV